jgi:hypothetical protein
MWPYGGAVAALRQIGHTPVVGDELPDRLLSPDGRSGWYAFNPDGSRIDEDEEPWRAPPNGSTIRLMGEDTVDVPLWSEDGLMFNDSDELIREFGVSVDLAADIMAWAVAWQSRSGNPDLDAAAATLVRRLNEELAHRYRIVYKP